MHRGNGLIVDNIMKPLKAAVSTAANRAGRAVARAISKKAFSKKEEKATSKAASKAIEKSGDVIRKRLQEINRSRARRAPSRREISKEDAKLTRNKVNTN